MTDKPPTTFTARVLTVDDSAISRRQVKNALEQAGISVTEASEGVEALWRARQQSFDLVLTDIHMPTMDGLEFIRELRKSAGYERTPVYVLTSDASRERFQEARAAGATAWISKPPNLPLLVKAVIEGAVKSR